MALEDFMVSGAVSPDVAGVDISQGAVTIGDEYGSPPSILDQSFTLLPNDGQRYIEGRANTENPSGNFLGWDQSKITGPIFDVLGAATKAVGIASQEAVKGALKGGSTAGQSWINKFVSDFSSTKTGAQMQAAGRAQYLRQLFMNPLTWVIAGVVGYFLVLGFMGATRRA